ncbi:Putative 3-methyladenine DNA glycosylase, partial [Frankliniella fusca]
RRAEQSAVTARGVRTCVGQRALVRRREAGRVRAEPPGPGPACLHLTGTRHTGRARVSVPCLSSWPDPVVGTGATGRVWFEPRVSDE